MDGETWEPPLEMSPQLETDRRSMLFRLARKRAAYFADVGDLSSQTRIDELPTQRYSALWRAIKLGLVVTRILSVEEQPTLEIPIAERSTAVPAAAVSLLASAETLKLNSSWQ
jgi:hypothetical protein